MDFDQLHTFTEIVRLKSFSKAAKTCFRTQPAISAQIRQMEQELGTQLFERFGSRISITAAGRIFHDYAQRVLALKKEGFDAVAELERVPRGEISIAANEATCLYILPTVFSEYKQQFPGVQLHVVRSYGSDTVSGVLENNVDFGIAQLPIKEKRLEVVPLQSDEIQLLAPVGHPLERLKRVTADDLLEYPLLLPKHGRSRTRILEFLEPIDDEMNISMELDSSEMIKQFTVAGIGVGFLARSHFQAEVEAGRLIGRSLAPLPVVRSIGLIYRKDKALPRAGLGFIEVVGKLARELQDQEARSEPGGGARLQAIPKRASKKVS